MKPKKIADNIYKIEPQKKVVKVFDDFKTFEMKVPCYIYANEELIQQIERDKSIDQMTNVACLPGIMKQSICMSDAHQGYGFPIGGVAATDINGGAISPGGVGYDINCGVRLLRTGLTYNEVQPKLADLIEAIFHNIPSGLGSRGRLNISKEDLDRLLENGINWAIDKGFGFDKDRETLEDNGMLEGADASLVSQRAKSRGIKQIGSLGSGNHFLELQRVHKIFDEEAAKTMGIKEGDITVMIHTGSRAMGHQICTDSLQEINRTMKQDNIITPDRELAYVLSGTRPGDNYLARMRAAANFGYTNRHIIMHWVREAFNEVLNVSQDQLELVYGVCHNILKQEKHVIDGKEKMVNVHRKGATRAFPPNHPELTAKYRSIGQPVLIPGSMGTSSYLCVGQENAMDLSFGSTAHGGGRVMSRSKAKREFWGKTIKEELNKQGILIRADSLKVVAEEAPLAYKNIDTVVNVSHELKIVKKVAQLVPIAVAKG